MAEEILKRFIQKRRENRYARDKKDPEEAKLRLDLKSCRSGLNAMGDAFGSIVCEKLLDIPQRNQPTFSYVSRIQKKCWTCLGISAELLRCSACKKTYYCSIECQRKDWKKHKPRCKFLVDIFEKGQTMFGDSDKDDDKNYDDDQDDEED
jgi:hypothetical protein